MGNTSASQSLPPEYHPDTIINLTPHQVKIIPKENEQAPITIKPSSSGPLRLHSSTGRTAWTQNPFTGLPIFQAPKFDGFSYHRVQEDPKTVQGVIVSLPVADFLRSTSQQVSRNADAIHVLTPDTGPESAVRNDQGVIQGVRNLNYWGTISKDNFLWEGY